VKQFNIATIKAAQPGDVLRDAVVPGLQLRVFPTKRAFYIYYRTRSGIQRKPKIGDWPTLTIDQARHIAKGWIAEAHNGGDPSKARHDSINAPTLADLRERYMARHGAKKKTGERDRASFVNHIEPIMGSKTKVADITSADIERFMDKMAAKGAPVQGNRCLSLLSKALNLAVKWGWRTDNPAKGGDRHPEKKRRRYLTPDEYRALGLALAALEAESPGGVAAIRVMLLTGARLGEIVGARREWLRDGVLHLPDSKTGEKDIHIPAAALAIIEATLPIDGSLVGIRSRPSKVWDKALTMAGITDLRLHDLRHSFASQALASGLTLPQIGELLGHKSTQTTKRYAHLEDELKKEAAGMVADRLMIRLQNNS